MQPNLYIHSSSATPTALVKHHRPQTARWPSVEDDISYRCRMRHVNLSAVAIARTSPLDRTEFSKGRSQHADVQLAKRCPEAVEPSWARSAHRCRTPRRRRPGCNLAGPLHNALDAVPARCDTGFA